MSNLGGNHDVDMQSLVEAMQQQIAQMQATIATQTAQLVDRTLVVNYASEKAKFIEWWTKMKIWVRANNDTFSNSFELCMAVWSRLTGPIAGQYTQTRMVECLNANHWPRDTELIEEIQTCKQGNLQVDKFISKWLSLFRQSKISDEHGVYLLESNTSAHIIKQNIGQAQEAYLTFQSAAKTQGRAWVTTCLGLRPMEGRVSQWTLVLPPKAEEQAPWSATSVAKGDTLHAIGKGKRRKVQSTSMSDDTPQSQVGFKQMDFEEAKAFFYDMQVAEMKSQGKGFGP
ncbi:hypothetical protein HYDPIDRAFT_29056 [Hydnomerulius pinastri MD-312]|uniref:Retrotransposon gag domain-containing protein n=1 Tax=Hydnomerulius pinastri MD-312 TaxID=994086 RepID=A0A0C9VDY4_9AGAM|nr:hypothetical protein HYDPIDRAFT_29056 [Hydnomerulius pinastri MD-312]